MKENSKKIATILSCFQILLSIGIGFVYTPILIKYLGDSEFGLYQTIASTITVLSLLNLGLNSSYIRFFSIYNSENDINSIHKLNGLFIIIFSVIGVIALFCGLFLSYHLDLIYLEGLSPDEYKIAFHLMIVSSINLAISFPLSVFVMIVSAQEKFIYLKFLSIINTVLGPIVTFPLLIFGYRSIVLVWVSLFICVINGVVNGIYVVFVLKTKFIFHGFPSNILRDVLGFSKYIAINLIVDQINWNIDKILLGRFKGTISVAIYTVGYSFFTYYLMLSVAISEVYIPFVHNLVNKTASDLKRQRNELTDVFIKVGRIQFVVLGLVASGLIIFGKYFICSIWLDESYADSYIVAILLVLSSSFALIQNIGIEIQRAENKHKFRSWLYLGMAVINFIMSVYLGQRYGAIGTTLGTAISLVLANGLLMNIYYYKKCNINIVAFWKDIFVLSKGLIVPVMLGIVFIYFIGINNKLIFILGIIVYSIVYFGSAYLWGLNTEEKDSIHRVIRRLFGIKFIDGGK